MADQQQQIPRKGLSEASYAVHRPSDSEASPSNAVEEELVEHDQHERTHTPPPYSGPASPTRAPEAQWQSQIDCPGLPKLDYRLYSPSSFTLSQDQTTISSRDPQLNTQRTALLTLIQRLAYIPPKPHIRIVGKGSDGSIDFDVKFNAMNLILPKGEKQRMNYIKTIPPGELGFRGQIKKTAGPGLEGLERWVRNYCEDDSSIKHFALDRIVINWDTSYLEGRLLSLLKNISYRGHVTVTFPVTHSRVMIHSPDKMNRFISNVTKVFTGTHKYEPVKSIWPYANMPRGEPGRRCAVQDEDAWFDDWKDSIAHAVLSRRKSWITIEDRLEVLMEPKPMMNGKPAEWGTT